MKTLKKISVVFITMLFCINFISCNEKEDEPQIDIIIPVPEEPEKPTPEEEDLGYSYDESTNTYSVWKANGLYKWQEATLTDPSTNLILTDDIVLPTNDIEINNGIPNGSNWTPVGNSSNIYIGTIEGNGKTISGLRIKNNTFNTGFIGCMNTDGKIMNLTLKDIVVYSPEQSLGCITGLNVGTILNCNILEASVLGKRNSVGGITGYNSGVISNCSFSGSIISDDECVGGIVGKNFNFISGCKTSDGSVQGDSNVGGVVGYNWSQGPIMACSNNADVSGNVNIGGIVGINIAEIFSSWTKATLEKDEEGNAISDNNKDGIGSNNDQGGRGKSSYCYSFSDTDTANYGTINIDGEEKSYIDWMNYAISTYNSKNIDIIPCEFLWEISHTQPSWPILKYTGN